MNRKEALNQISDRIVSLSSSTFAKAYSPSQTERYLDEGRVPVMTEYGKVIIDLERCTLSWDNIPNSNPRLMETTPELATALNCLKNAMYERLLYAAICELFGTGYLDAVKKIARQLFWGDHIGPCALIFDVRERTYDYIAEDDLAFQAGFAPRSRYICCGHSKESDVKLLKRTLDDYTVFNHKKCEFYDELDEEEKTFIDDTVWGCSQGRYEMRAVTALEDGVWEYMKNWKVFQQEKIPKIFSGKNCFEISIS